MKRIISFILTVSMLACSICACSPKNSEIEKLATPYEGKEYHITAESTLDIVNELNHRLLRYDDMRIGDADIPEASFNSFNMGWQASALLWHNATEEAYGADKITPIYTNFLYSKTQDDYGYIYNQNDFREGPKDEGMAAWGTVAGGPQGWTFPIWTEAVADPFADNGVADRFFTSFDFGDVNDDTNKKWVAENGTITVDGSGYAFLATDNIKKGESYRFYKNGLADLFTKYGGIVGSQAAFVELDMDFQSNNLADICLIWQTKESGDIWFSASAADYVTVSNSDYKEYSSRSYWPMYLNDNWNGKTITAIGVEFVPVEGKTVSLTNARINYLRPAYDTRQPQFAFQWMNTFYNYVCYKRDSEALEELMPKARKVMLFFLHCLQGETGLINLDFFSGHNGIGTTINPDGSVTTHPGEGVASSYWDTLALSEINLESNAYFYTCLQQMAQLEAYCEENSIAIEEVSIKNRVIGEAPVAYRYDSAKLYALAEQVHAKFSEDIQPVLEADGRYTNEGGLWNPETGRFALGINEATGEIVDHGYVLFNEQAIIAGLGTDAQRLCVMQWINGDRIVEGDLSTGEDIYFYEFAPRFTTDDCLSQFNFCLAELNFGEESAWKTYGSLFSRQVQNGGAVLWASYYDIVARAQVLGTDNAYTRIEEIASWYNKVKDNTEGEGTSFFENYYYHLENYGETAGEGFYKRQAANVEGAGALGLDSEFLENVILVRAVPDALFGMKSLSADVVSFTHNLPEKLSFLRLDNLRFGKAVYSVVLTENEAEISDVSGAVSKEMQVQFRFGKPNDSYQVYINGVKTENYTVEDGYVCVTVPFGMVKVSVK